jgi:hypothetical protein
MAILYTYSMVNMIWFGADMYFMEGYNFVNSIQFYISTIGKIVVMLK